MNHDIHVHCAEIERCNQRGGRMLSIVDLIEAGTMGHELTAYSQAAISAGASFLVGALPGGAGKTTVMGALLNFVPRDVELVPTEDETVIEQGLRDRSRRCCYICHEIGNGAYYAYLWGDVLRRFFNLPGAGHMIATNLHADTFEQARRQVCEENSVPAAAFRGVNLLFFLAVERQAHGSRRRIAAVWESDGTGEHRQVFDGGAGAPVGSRLVSTDAFQAAGRRIDRLLQAKVRRIEDVRAALVGQETET